MPLYGTGARTGAHGRDHRVVSSDEGSIPPLRLCPLTRESESRSRGVQRGVGTRPSDLSRVVRDSLLEPDGATPQYLRVADVVRELILTGELSLGTRMPSERELADAASISRTTVIAAYNVLRADSLLMTQGRVGTWVSAVPQ